MKGPSKRALLYSLTANISLIAALLLHPTPELSTIASSYLFDEARALKWLRAKVSSGIAAGDAIALKNIGFSDADVSERRAGGAYAMYAKQIRDLDAEEPPGKYWQHGWTSHVRSQYLRRQNAKYKKAGYAFEKAMRKVFGEFNPDNRGHDLLFLPPAKQKLLLQLDRDYTEMRNELELRSLWI